MASCKCSASAAGSGCDVKIAIGVRHSNLLHAVLVPLVVVVRYEVEVVAARCGSRLEVLAEMEDNVGHYFDFVANDDFQRYKNRIQEDQVANSDLHVAA
jgi:hypothetical protein